MRDTHFANIKLLGNKEQAVQHIPVAQTLLGTLKSYSSGLTSNWLRRNIDGVEYYVGFIKDYNYITINTNPLGGLEKGFYDEMFVCQPMTPWQRVGWGKPYVDELGAPINPPLGTYNGTSQWNAVFRPNKKFSTYQIKRSFISSRSNGDPKRGNISWILKEKTRPTDTQVARYGYLSWYGPVSRGLTEPWYEVGSRPAYAVWKNAEEYYAYFRTLGDCTTTIHYRLHRKNVVFMDGAVLYTFPTNQLVLGAGIKQFYSPVKKKVLIVVTGTPDVDHDSVWAIDLSVKPYTPVLLGEIEVSTTTLIGSCFRSINTSLHHTHSYFFSESGSLFSGLIFRDDGYGVDPDIPLTAKYWVQYSIDNDLVLSSIKSQKITGSATYTEVGGTTFMPPPDDGTYTEIIRTINSNSYILDPISVDYIGETEVVLYREETVVSSFERLTVPANGGYSHSLTNSTSTTLRHYTSNATFDKTYSITTDSEKIYNTRQTAEGYKFSSSETLTKNATGGCTGYFHYVDLRNGTFVYQGDYSSAVSSVATDPEEGIGSQTDTSTYAYAIKWNTYNLYTETDSSTLVRETIINHPDFTTEPTVNTSTTVEVDGVVVLSPFISVGSPIGVVPEYTGQELELVHHAFNSHNDELLSITYYPNGRYPEQHKSVFKIGATYNDAVEYFELPDAPSPDNPYLHGISVINADTNLRKITRK